MHKFIWTPSYATQINLSTEINSLQLGGGYSQKSSKGMQNVRLGFSMMFNMITDEEVRAITGFLSVMGGVTAFEYNPPPPFDFEDLPSLDIGDSVTPIFGTYAVANNSSGTKVVLLCIKSSPNLQNLLNKEYFKYMWKLPLLFTAQNLQVSFAQYNASNLTVDFIPEIRP